MGPDDPRRRAAATAEALLTGDLPDELALRGVVEALADAHPAWGWVGIYLLAGDTLVLGPSVGPPTTPASRWGRACAARPWPRTATSSSTTSAGSTTTWPAPCAPGRRSS